MTDTTKKTAKKPLDANLQADVDYLSTLLAKGVSGLIELGITDGIKMKGAMDRIRKSDAGIELAAKMWSQFWMLNPHASSAIELAASFNPKLREFLEKMQLKAKPAEDVEIKDAEKA